MAFKRLFSHRNQRPGAIRVCIGIKSVVVPEVLRGGAGSAVRGVVVVDAEGQRCAADVAAAAVVAVAAAGLQRLVVVVRPAGEQAEEGVEPTRDREIFNRAKAQMPLQRQQQQQQTIRAASRQAGRNTQAKGDSAVESGQRL